MLYSLVICIDEEENESLIITEDNSECMKVIVGENNGREALLALVPGEALKNVVKCGITLTGALKNIIKCELYKYYTHLSDALMH